ncbi:MAG TPA: hypothetical protein DCQ28_00935 [Bacteroidetes bacterium]|nr:hypothetical protein [Bacteroidota bacterium]
MKKVLIAVVLLVGISSVCVSGVLPIEYQIDQNYHRMRLMLHGDVRWNVSRSDSAFDITVMGSDSCFIYKKEVTCNFRNGIIKKFNYKTSPEGTKKISIELRNGVNDYKIYQDEVSKNLYIEFYPELFDGTNRIKNISDKKTIPATEKQLPAPQPKQSVVDIPQIVLDQVEQQPKKESEEPIVPVAAPITKSANTSSAALWLILVSVSILLTGGGFTVYAFLRRRTAHIAKLPRKNETPAAMPERRTNVEHSVEPIIPSTSAPGIVITGENENSVSHSMEFSEQYLRSRGELDLQQRLESMSARSTQKKVGISITSTKKKDPAALAQKLGLSVGELELVSRLQKFHKQHSEEVL